MRRLRLLLATALLAATAACANDGLFPATDAAVVGDWVAVHGTAGSASTEESFTFRADGTYRQAVEWRGFHGRPASETTGYVRTSGLYRVDGGRLMLRVVQSESWELNAVGENPTRVTLTQGWQEHGTLARDGDALVHTFVAAPADAPETFRTVYQRR